MAVSEPPTSHAREYAALQLRLQELFQAGQGDGDEADAIRDRMDGPWYRMTQAERDRMRGLATDLNALLDGGPPAVPMLPDELAAYRSSMAQAVRERQTGGQDSLLTALRGSRPAGHVPRSDVLYLQQRVWTDLGYPEVGLALLREAEKEDPSLTVFTLLALRDLGRDDEALEYAGRILRDPKLSADGHAVFQAGATVYGRPRGDTDPATRSLLERTREAARRYWANKEQAAQRDPEDPMLVPAVGNLLGLVLEELGDTAGAINVYGRVINLAPNDPDAWVMRGVARLPSDRRAALRDMEEAIRRGARTLIPYVLKGHDLLDHRPAEAVSLVNQAVSRFGNLEGPLGAVLFQVRAFAMMALGQPVGRVLDDFDRASVLDPSNGQIRRNRELVRSQDRRIPADLVPSELVRREVSSLLPRRRLVAPRGREALAGLAN